MPPRKPEAPEVPDEAWPLVWRAMEMFRLTNAQVGEWLGYSASRIKQRRNEYRSYRTPSGGWTSGPRRHAEGVEGADSRSVTGADEVSG